MIKLKKLKSAFRRLDIDNSGTLGKDEFMKGMSAFNSLLQNPISENSLEDIFVYFDKNNDGFVDYSEFICGLKIVSKQTAK